MIPRPAYYSILDVSIGWHGVAVPNKIRSALPPLARVTLAMLLRAVVDARLAVYEPSTGAATDAAKLRNASVVMDEVEGTPSALVQMSASGAYDAKVLAHYRVCMDELFVWAIGEDLDPPTCCVPSWTCVRRPATTTQARKMRPECYDNRVCVIGKAIADSADAARRFDGRTRGCAPMPAVVGAGMSVQDR